MEIRFEVPGPDGDGDLLSLYDWLADDRLLRRHARIQPVTDSLPGRMGPGLEAVLAVISTTAALAQMPLSYMAWRDSRRPQASVTVNVLGATAAETEAILRSLGGAAPSPEGLPTDGRPVADGSDNRGTTDDTAEGEG